jgi:hypothetical protein
VNAAGRVLPQDRFEVNFFTEPVNASIGEDRASQ